MNNRRPAVNCPFQNAARAELQPDLTSMPVNPPVAVQPGVSWGFQAWYRDVGNTNNFTDAAAVTFQ